MIKTIDGCFVFQWDHTYYFLDCNYPSFTEAAWQQDFKTLSEIACLEEDENGNFIKSNWETVKNSEQLKNHIRYIQQKPITGSNYDN